MVSSAKAGYEKTAARQSDLEEIWLELGEVEGNSKIKTRLELQLNGKEAEKSSTGKLNSNLEPAYLSLIGDS